MIRDMYTVSQKRIPPFLDVLQMGVVLCRAWNERQWTLLLGYNYAQQTLADIKHVAGSMCIVLSVSATNSPAYDALNTVQSQQCCVNLAIISPDLWPRPKMNSSDYNI